jgi:hypothetical protein
VIPNHALYQLSYILKKLIHTATPFACAPLHVAQRPEHHPETLRYGAACRNRTDCLDLGKVALYLLSLGCMRSRIVKEQKDCNAVPSLAPCRRHYEVARLGIRPTHSCNSRSHRTATTQRCNPKQKARRSLRNIRAFGGASCRRYTAFSETLGCGGQSLGL